MDRQATDNLSFMWARHRQRSENSKDSLTVKDTIPMILYGNRD